MKEYNTYLDYTGSLNIYQKNTGAVFRNFGDWRVALAEIIFFTISKNFTSNDCLMHSKCIDGSLTKPDSDGLHLSRRSWEFNADILLVCTKNGRQFEGLGRRDPLQ